MTHKPCGLKARNASVNLPGTEPQPFRKRCLAQDWLALAVPSEIGYRHQDRELRRIESEPALRPQQRRRHAAEAQNRGILVPFPRGRRRFIRFAHFRTSICRQAFFAICSSGNKRPLPANRDRSRRVASDTGLLSRPSSREAEIKPNSEKDNELGSCGLSARMTRGLEANAVHSTPRFFIRAPAGERARGSRGVKRVHRLANAGQDEASHVVASLADVVFNLRDGSGQANPY